MNKQYFLSVIFAAASCFAINSTALASDLCPEGQIGIVNSTTRSLSCITPEDLEALKAAQSDDVSPELQPDTSSQADNASQPDTQESTDTTTNAPTEQSVASDAPAQPDAPETDASTDQASQTNLDIYSSEYLERQRVVGIHEAITSAGWSFEGGIGSSLSFNPALTFKLKLALGYSLNYVGRVGFGFYLDANFRPYGDYYTDSDLYTDFTADISFLPKLHVVNDGIFRFSVGLGLGLGLDRVRDTSEHIVIENDFITTYPSHEINTGCSFILKPTLEFVWFITRNTWLGFGGDIPVTVVTSEKSNQVASVPLSIDAYFSFGYKLF